VLKNSRRLETNKWLFYETNIDGDPSGNNSQNHADRGMQSAVDSSRFSPISVSADTTGNFIYVTRGVDNNPERFRIERFCRCGMPSRSAVL
jgi:hypothetical protein